MLKDLLFRTTYNLFLELKVAYGKASTEVICELEAKYCVLRGLICDARLCGEYEEYLTKKEAGNKCLKLLKRG